MQDTHRSGPYFKIYPSRNIHFFGVAAFALLGLLIAPAALAQTSSITTLATFKGKNGSDPEGGLTLIGSTLYGTTQGGGAYGKGEVFSVSTKGGKITVIATFNGANGKWPNGGLVLRGSTLYGATNGGGTYDKGTVFSVPTKGGKITVLASFNGANGKWPNGDLVLSGNTLYGTTSVGGLISTTMPNGGAFIGGSYSADNSGNGTVFSLPITGGKPTVLARFNGANGKGPGAGLTLSGSTLYGTTSDGGAYYQGTVFSVPITGGTPTVLTSFNGKNGKWPNAGLVLSGNTLYGTTEGGENAGSVFSVPITGGDPTVLATLNGTNGYWLHAGLALSGTTLYGNAWQGGSTFVSWRRPGDGTVFSVPIRGGAPAVLASFNGKNGKYPMAGLTLSGNTLYGTTSEGGAGGYGTVFSLTPPPEASSVLSLGLLLALVLGVIVILGAIVFATKRASSQGKA